MMPCVTSCSRCCCRGGFCDVWRGGGGGGVHGGGSPKRQAQFAVAWRRRRAARTVRLCVWRALFSCLGDGASNDVALLCLCVNDYAHAHGFNQSAAALASLLSWRCPPINEYTSSTSRIATTSQVDDYQMMALARLGRLLRASFWHPRSCALPPGPCAVTLRGTWAQEGEVLTTRWKRVLYIETWVHAEGEGVSMKGGTRREMEEKKSR